MDPFNRDLLNFRPEITYVAPMSTDVVPEYQEPPTPRLEQVKQLKQGFDNVVKIADTVEKAIDSRVGKFKAKLNPFASPEDLATAQALGRMFPEMAKEIMPGVKIVDVITYDMFKHCVKHLEDHGKKQADKSLTPKASNISPTRINFGGVGGADNRPEINNLSAPIAPLDIPAFIAAGIPILFSMLFPLISGYVTSEVVAHSHVGADGVPTTGGVPINTVAGFAGLNPQILLDLTQSVIDSAT